MIEGRVSYETETFVSRNSIKNHRLWYSCLWHVMDTSKQRERDSQKRSHFPRRQKSFIQSNGTGTSTSLHLPLIGNGILVVSFVLISRRLTWKLHLKKLVTRESQYAFLSRY